MGGCIPAFISSFGLPGIKGKPYHQAHFGQSVNPNHLHGLEDLRTIYDKAQFVELNKSYRSSYEIMRFAKKIHHVSALEPV